ncbi:hypothetical protein F4808DRAFT_420194 [Astrocystis sublimbata]|nr:hypothetical protein F4808DRAFT_420194 [Astrocystis sublimbata]
MVGPDLDLDSVEYFDPQLLSDFLGDDILPGFDFGNVDPDLEFEARLAEDIPLNPPPQSATSSSRDPTLELENDLSTQPQQPQPQQQPQQQQQFVNPLQLANGGQFALTNPTSDIAALSNIDNVGNIDNAGIVSFDDSPFSQEDINSLLAMDVAALSDPTYPYPLNTQMYPFGPSDGQFPAQGQQPIAYQNYWQPPTISLPNATTHTTNSTSNIFADTTTNIPTGIRTSTNTGTGTRTAADDTADGTSNATPPTISNATTNGPWISPFNAATTTTRSIPPTAQ